MFICPHLVLTPPLDKNDRKGRGVQCRGDQPGKTICTMELISPLRQGRGFSVVAYNMSTNMREDFKQKSVLPPEVKELLQF